MLANVEQQMQFDPSANISTDFGLWESPRELISEKCKQKPYSSAETAESENETQNSSQLNDSINSSSINDESEEEIFHIDSYVSQCLKFNNNENVLHR